MKVKQPSPAAPKRSLDTLTRGDVFEIHAKTGQFYMVVNDRRQPRSITSVVLATELVTGELRQFSASLVVYVYPFAELNLHAADPTMQPRELPGGTP